MDTSTYNKGIYRDNGKLNGAYYKLFDGRTKKIIELLKGFNGQLLDIGCGDATMTLQIKKALGCKVKAVELIEENVKKACKKGVDAKKVDLNIEKLPFEDGSFDCVFAGEIIEHVVDSDGLLLEMKRVLKKNGILILTVPNIANWYNRFIMLFGYLPHYVESGSTRSYGTPFGVLNGHVKAFTKGSVVEMLKSHGFRIETVEGTGYAKTEVKAYNKGLMRLGARLFFATEKVLSKRSSLATNIVVKAIKC